MKTDRQGRWARWRALCAALCLLFGVVSAPVALASRSAGDVCTMACCVKEGHCCCKPRHAFVEGQANDGKPHIARAEVAAPCPADCAGFSTSSPSFTRQALGPADHRMDDVAAPAAHLSLLVGKSLATASDTSAPRAPPTRLLHSAN